MASAVYEASDKTSVRETLVSEYRLIIPTGCGADFNYEARDLSTALSIGDQHLMISTDRDFVKGKEILFGNTSREDSSLGSDLGPLDYVIKICPDGNIVLLGGSGCSTSEAARVFVEMVLSGALDSLEPENSVFFVFSESFEMNPLCDRNSEEFKSFVSGWLSERTSAAWGGFDRDLKECIYAVSRTSKYKGEGRIAMLAHRGDMSNYPENSLEGIISAILSGADTIEFDYRLTRDHVPVVFHDAVLTRLTNWEELHGKNGLPDSESLVDWTFDELRQLSLLDYWGNVTTSKVASLYEAMTLASGVIQFFFDDKGGADFSYEKEYLALAKETGSCDSMILGLFRFVGNISAIEGIISEDLYSFAQKCASSGKFRGCYAFYNDSTAFKNSFGSNYLSLEEDSTFWSNAVLSKGKAYIGTNRIYALSRCLEDELGMTPWNY